MLKLKIIHGYKTVKNHTLNKLTTWRSWLWKYMYIIHNIHVYSYYMSSTKGTNKKYILCFIFDLS